MADTDPIPAEHEGLYQWSAALKTAHEVNGRLFETGQLFILAAPKDTDGSVLFTENEVLAAPATSLHRLYDIPVEKLDVGERSLDQGTITMVDDVDITSRWQYARDGIQVHDRFGHILLALAEGLRANVGELLALRCNSQAVGLLNENFEEVFMEIYTGVPEAVKHVLSQLTINLADLEPEVIHDQERQKTIHERVDLGNVVYLRHYTEVQDSLGQRDKDGVYVGITNDFHRRDDQHAEAIKNKEGVHYDLAYTARTFRAIVLSRIGADRNVLYIAEQLFNLFFGSWANFLKEYNKDIFEARKPTRIAQYRALNSIALAAYDNLGYLPQYSTEFIGCNVDAPLSTRSWSRRSWTREDHEDRYLFRCESLATLSVKGGLCYVTLFGTLYFGFSNRIGFNLREYRPLIDIQVEIMKNGEPHPEAFARCPNVGPVSDIGQANSLGVFLQWTDPSGTTLGHYSRTTRAGMPGQKVELRIDGSTINVPRSYVVAMIMCNTFLKRTLAKGVPRVLRGYSISIYNSTYSFKDNTVYLKLIKDMADGAWAGPSVVDLETNMQILTQQYGLVTDPDVVAQDSRKTRCDLCQLFRRDWWALGKNRSDRDCEMMDGLCKNWSWLHIAPTYSTKQRLVEVDGLFFQRIKDFEPKKLPQMYIDRNLVQEAEEFDDWAEETTDLNIDAESDDERLEELADVDEADAAEDDDNVFDSSATGKRKALRGTGTTRGAATTGTAASSAQYSAVTRADQVLMVFEIREEYDHVLLLVSLNDIDDEPVLVDIEDLAHQRDVILEYLKDYPDIKPPSWAIQKRKRTDAEDQEDKEDGDEFGEDGSDEEGPARKR